jgi:phosphoribosylanthranilate isomerase
MTSTSDDGPAAPPNRDAPPTTGRPRVKLCGTTSDADRDAAVVAGGDAVGAITEVAVETPREVTPERATALLAGVPPFVTGVLVTMPESVTAAQSLVDRVDPDALQVHDPDRLGGPAEAATLAKSLSIPLLLGVDGDDPATARDYDGVGDALLLDAVDAHGGGGTGHTIDWERTRSVVSDLDSPVVLAGGLTPENVAEAVATVRPFAVDVASGVEREPGRKDHDAMRRFVGAATGSAGPAATEVESE